MKGGIKMEGNRPIKKFRSGVIEAAIWLNSKKKDNEEISYKTVSISKSWKAKNDITWRNEVINLRKGDLQKVILVLQKAQEELLLSQEEGEEDE